ncbi:phosphatidylglycerol:prolipoprotein diacylglycerol transferase [Anaerovirgula multivorans]|uniref:Phosphatidylglycerol--prolipoprotein diacylglyceryl transferase n=1 Tax=Anaerovirgula multivorans TaxID=312168 RepID=A0A239BMA0_9FIRM|nr:prolipoprotein diacylglyceryl transferase [Anaerovirgula multivorans]SNS09275.1 phosphatidylglycerol:prolipoprotein diacylglycerol transferase [Anaerovirgula multivorans]
MKLLFSIGSFNIHLFGITIGLGILAGFYIMLMEANRKGLDRDKLMDLAIYTVIIGVIGARINYILAFNPGYYLQHPREIFMINQGGLSIQGSLIAGTLFALWYMKRKNIPIWQTADAFAPAIIIGQAIGRIGCDVFGIPMMKQYFWGISVGGQLLHPAQIYEAVLNYVLFFVLWNKRKNVKYEGQLFITYIIGFSINRFIVEFFRSNPLVVGAISIAHVYSLAIIVIAFAAGLWLKRRHEKLQLPVVNNTPFIEEIDWKGAVYISIATVVSIIVYYAIHIFL